MAEEMNSLINEFEKGRMQLMNVAGQKQQLSFSAESAKVAIEELDKSSEKKVLKAIGNILVFADKAETRKELEKRRESEELKLKTVEKQEKLLVEKLNKLKSDIESKQKKEK